MAICASRPAPAGFFTTAASFSTRRGGLARLDRRLRHLGAISGSSLATVATVGSVALPIAVPAMTRFCAGARRGGTWGPSSPVRRADRAGIIAEQSIGQLFAAAVIPGLSQALFYMITIAIVCRAPGYGPDLGPGAWRGRMTALNMADVTLSSCW
jgi:TRAP-type C4-dicarboxylate transport system permease large subunit